MNFVFEFIDTKFIRGTVLKLLPHLRALCISQFQARSSPPPGNPQAFDPCSAPHSGAFDANRSPTHRAFDPSKKCWSSVARKKDFVLHVTSHNSSWFSTTYMLIYAIFSVLKKFGNNYHYRRFGIFRRT